MKKPLIYVDQTIVSRQAEGILNYEKIHSVQWVYSKEHFAEIRRSDHPDQFLSALDEISAQLLEFELSEGKITGRANLIESGSASDHYADYIEAVDEVSFDATLFNPLIAWLNGGECKERLLKVPDVIQDQLSNPVNNLPSDLIQKSSTESFSEFRKIVEQLASTENNIDNTREKLGVGKGAAGSISGDNQLLQIWEKINPHIPGITSDQFFGFSSSTQASQTTWPIYLGIISCCAVLDILGFKAETKARNPNKIPNVMSDAAHIASGAYCAAIISMDKRLAQRAKAIYQYKQISTIPLTLTITPKLG